jgi:DNA-binding CsgD family transcriptional regulator
LSQKITETVVDGYIGEHQPIDPIGKLSNRERQILQLVAEGKSTADIASTLFLSPKTIDTYRSRLMQKLDLDSFAALVKFAIACGLTVRDTGVSTHKGCPSSLKRSTQPRAVVWRSVYRSVARLSRAIMAVFGRHRMMVLEPRFLFPSLAPRRAYLILGYRPTRSSHRSQQGTSFTIGHMATLGRSGRILLHLLAMLRDRYVRFLVAGMVRELRHGNSLQVERSRRALLVPATDRRQSMMDIRP